MALAVTCSNSCNGSALIIWSHYSIISNLHFKWRICKAVSITCCFWSRLVVSLWSTDFSLVLFTAKLILKNVLMHTVIRNSWHNLLVYKTVTWMYRQFLLSITVSSCWHQRKTCKIYLQDEILEVHNAYWLKHGPLLSINAPEGMTETLKSILCQIGSWWK